MFKNVKYFGNNKKKYLTKLEKMKWSFIKSISKRVVLLTV